MDSLASFRDDLLRNIEESLDLIRTVNSIICLCFVRGHLESLQDYMLGVQTAAGFAPRRYVFPSNEQHALDIVLGSREYFPWTAPDSVRRQSILCFEDGQPFRQILDSTTTELQEINTVRNAVVHRSRVAVEKFKSLVRDKILTAPPDVTPARFLLATKSGTTGRTYFSHYCNKLRIVVNKVVPA